MSGVRRKKCKFEFTFNYICPYEDPNGGPMQ